MTNQELAKKLNGDYWHKHGIERIYLPLEGYNTRKMSTKTYVECEDGNFTVKCFIDCPSQPWVWRKAQQELIMESVESRIQRILANILYYLTNEEDKPIDLTEEVVSIGDLTDVFISEAEAKKAAEDEGIENFNIKTISKDDYNKERKAKV